MYRVTIFFLTSECEEKKQCIVTKVNVHSFVLYNLQSKAHLFCPSCVFFLSINPWINNYFVPILMDLTFK